MNHHQDLDGLPQVTLNQWIFIKYKTRRKYYVYRKRANHLVNKSALI